MVHNVISVQIVSLLCVCVWKELKEQFQLVPLFLSVGFSHLKPKGSKGRHRVKGPESHVWFLALFLCEIRPRLICFVQVSPPFARAFNADIILKMLPL